MTAPLVSIIVVNYNYGRFLHRSINSALAQTHPQTEVIVVDDASSDESRDVIGTFAGRIRPVLRERNGGQGAAFNAGFQACGGEVVLFLDSDDWLYPEAAARAVAAFSAGVAKVQFRLHLVDESGRLIDLFPAPEISFEDGDVVPQLLRSGRYATTVTSGNAFARTTLSAILPIPEEDFRVAADGYVVTVAPLFGRVVSIEDPLGAYVQHGGNMWKLGTGPQVAESFRRCLLHDSRRHEALRRKAAQRGLLVPRDVGLWDPLHLSYRLGSLTVDPSNHSEGSDSRPGLAVRGAWASCRARLPASRRLLLAGWFLAGGFLPRRLAVPLILWRMTPETRPPALRQCLQRVRSWLR